MLVPNQGDNLGDDNENNNDHSPGEFDGDEPENLLIHVQESKGSVPVTHRTLRILPDSHVGLRWKATGTSTARSTEQVGPFLSFIGPLTQVTLPDGDWVPASETQ